MTSVPSSELRDRIAAASSSRRQHLAVRWSSRDGTTIRCKCGNYEPIIGTVREQEDAHRAHRVAMGETVKPRVLSKVERLEAENARLRAELEQARQQPPTDITIHTRKPGKWRFVDTETGQVWAWDVQQGGFKLAGEAAPVEICEIPHATVEEEDACEQQRLAGAATRCTCGEGSATLHFSNCRLYTGQLLKPQKPSA